MGLFFTVGVATNPNTTAKRLTGWDVHKASSLEAKACSATVSLTSLLWEKDEH